MNVVNYSDWCSDVEASIAFFDQPFFVLYFKILLDFKSFLYILENSLLSDVSYANIFSKSGLSSQCFNIVFCQAEVFNSNESSVIN